MRRRVCLCLAEGSTTRGETYRNWRMVAWGVKLPQGDLRLCGCWHAGRSFVVPNLSDWDGAHRRLGGVSQDFMFQCKWCIPCWILHGRMLFRPPLEEAEALVEEGHDKMPGLLSLVLVTDEHRAYPGSGCRIAHRWCCSYEITVVLPGRFFICSRRWLHFGHDVFSVWNIPSWHRPAS